MAKGHFKYPVENIQNEYLTLFNRLDIENPEKKGEVARKSIQEKYKLPHTTAYRYMVILPDEEKKNKYDEGEKSRSRKYRDRIKRNDKIKYRNMLERNRERSRKYRKMEKQLRTYGFSEKELDKAISYIGKTELSQKADYILDVFDYRASVPDKSLSSKDRALFYRLENLKILRTDKEFLEDEFKPCWVMRTEEILKFSKDFDKKSLAR